MTYVAQRIGWTVLVLWLVATGSFALAYLLPADPARLVAGPHASAEVIARIRVELGLDQPVTVQYGRWLWGVLHGDLGQSYHTHEPVLDALRRAFPRTVELAIGASIFQWVAGVPLGVAAALRKGRLEDVAAMSLALIGISAPTFLVGLGLMFVFGFALGWFPIGGAGDTWAAELHGAVLPSLTLGIAGAAYYSRLVRGELLEVMSREYMRTARAKGLGLGAVVVRHGLPNALLPVVTFFGLDLGTMLGGAVVTETLFAWPGIGRLAVESVLNQDIPAMLGTVLVASLAIVLTNLAVDLVYAWLDPRIRAGAPS